MIIYANFLIMFAIYPPFLFRNFWRIRGGDNISKIFATMIDNMDQGVLVVDDENRVQFVNQTALKTLGVVQNNIIGKPIRFRPLTFESNFTHGHMQHIVSWDDKK